MKNKGDNRYTCRIRKGLADNHNSLNTLKIASTHLSTLKMAKKSQKIQKILLAYMYKIDVKDRKSVV